MPETVKALTNAEIRDKDTHELKQMLATTSGELYKAVLAEYTARREARDAEASVQDKAPEIDAEAYLAALRAVPVMVRGARGGAMASKTAEAKLKSFLGVDDTLARAAVDRCIGRGVVGRDGKGRLTAGKVVA